MKDYFLIENNYLILVNKNYKLNDNYIPKDLVKISKKYSSKEIYLRKEAKKKFEKMAKAAKKQNNQ